MQTTQSGIDIANSVFEVELSETPGTVRERHRLSDEPGAVQWVKKITPSSEAALHLFLVGSKVPHDQSFR